LRSKLSYGPFRKFQDDLKDFFAYAWSRGDYYFFANKPSELLTYRREANQQFSGDTVSDFAQRAEYLTNRLASSFPPEKRAIVVPKLLLQATKGEEPGLFRTANRPVQRSWFTDIVIKIFSASTILNKYIADYFRSTSSGSWW
jgi:hypothetical protein